MNDDSPLGWKTQAEAAGWVLVEHTLGVYCRRPPIGKPAELTRVYKKPEDAFRAACEKNQEKNS